MGEEQVLLEVADGVATVTINRPRALNALTPEIITRLGEIVAGIGSDPSIRAAIVTGAGEKAFVAGADISLLEKMSPQEAWGLAESAHRVFSRIGRSPIPFIAAVNGYALGGGCELAMACDIRIASESARFGQPEVGLGIIPGFGGTQRLPRLVGVGRALEMILTGAMIDAREAERIGLVNRVYPPSQLVPEAVRIASLVARNGRDAVARAKEAVREGLESTLEGGCRHEAALFGLCFGTGEQQEGMAAFREKRPPRFSHDS